MSIIKQLKLRFIVIMLAYGCIVLLVYRDEALGSRLAPLSEWTARITSELIQWTGMDVLQEGAVLTHPDGFAYEIAYTCTGLLPIMTFIVCLLAYPAALWNKWMGIMLCAPVLLAVNYLRLVNLFFIGVCFPDAFELAPKIIWEGILAVSFISLWLSWMDWSNNRQEGEQIQMMIKKAGK